MPRRTRKAMIEPEHAPNVDAPKRNIHNLTKDTDSEEEVVRAVKTRRIDKPTAESEESQPTQRGYPIPIVPAEESAPAPRRNMQKTAVKRKNDSEESKTLASRRGRVPRVATASVVEKKTTESATLRTRPFSSQHDLTDADDPLNALNETGQGSADAALLPPKIHTRTRKPRITVKREPSAEALKASAKSRTSTITKTPSSSRSRARKTPATAPAVTQVPIDKENTPGDGAPVGSTADADEGVLVRVRTTRKTKMLPVKQETQEVNNVTQPKLRAARTTHVRTKTS